MEKRTPFNNKGELIMRLQNKNIRLEILNKDTDKQKVIKQTDRSSLPNWIMIHTSHIWKVHDWDETWYMKGEISKEGKEYSVKKHAKSTKKFIARTKSINKELHWVFYCYREPCQIY